MINMKTLKKGDRIRLKARTVSGWIGKGTVIEDQLIISDGVVFRKDGADPDTHEYELDCIARRHEVSVPRKGESDANDNT